MEDAETLLTSLALDYEVFSEAITGADGEMRLTARDEAPWLQDLLSIDGIVLRVMQEGGGEDRAPLGVRRSHHELLRWHRFGRPAEAIARFESSSPRTSV